MIGWHATCHNIQLGGNLQIQVGGYVPNESLNAY